MRHSTDSCTALIILNFNSADDTVNCIDSVASHNTAPVKFVVVDNGSTASGEGGRLIDAMKTRFGGALTVLSDSDTAPSSLPAATLLLSATNDGYARGNNKGLALAEADAEVSHIMILNSDILFIGDIIPPLLREMQRLDDCAVICPVLLTADGSSIDHNCARAESRVSDMVRNNFLHYFYRMAGKDDDDFLHHRHLLRGLPPDSPAVVPIELPSGSCMLATKSTFSEIGGFDPNTFLYYEEDILYSKLKRLGRRNYICTRLKCIHLGAASTKKVVSLRILEANRRSQKYYVENYSDASGLLKAAYRASLAFHSATTRAQKFLKRHT